MKRTRDQIDEDIEDQEPQEMQDSDNDSSDNELELMGEDAEEEIQVDFEVNEPNFDMDYHGIETFTQQLLNGDEFEYSPLVELLLGDEETKLVNPLTSVVKIPYEQVTTEPQEGDEVDLRDWDWNEDTYGVVSLVSFADKAVKKSVGKWLQETCTKTGGESLGNRMKNLVEGKSGELGLLVNMHVVNLPFELSTKLHENLWDEYREQVDKQQQKLYQNVVIISTVYEPKKKKNAAKKKFAHSKSIYPKFEESFYAKYATLQHRYSLESSEHFANNEVSMIDKTTGDRYGLIMVVPVAEVPKVLKDMDAALTQPTPQAKGGNKKGGKQQ